MIHYPIRLEDDDGSFLVTCPDLPEVTTFGETVDEAIVMGRNAVTEAIAARLSDFRAIPRPSESDVAVPIGSHLSLVLNLFWALHERGMSRADLMRTLGWNRTQVDRLFDPNHESKLSRFDEAFAALGREAALDLMAA